jgi:diguanylate cyclase (GGDEF)-like protein
MSAQPEAILQFDELTGLPNRFHLQRHLRERLYQANVNGSAVALAFFDIDKFKAINTHLHNHVGDALLKQIAERLRSTLLPSDFIARTGDDEFAILRCGSNDLTLLRHTISTVFDTPFQISGNTINATCGMGIAEYVTGGDDPLVILKWADLALQRAKFSGSGGCEFFTGDMAQHALAIMEMEKRLRKAIVNDELQLKYQPLVDLQTGRISGMEALMRWNSPEHGAVSPAQFIALAEETGLILELGAWAMGVVCRDMRHWLDADLGNFRVAINISTRQMLDSSLSETLLDLINTQQLRCDMFCLEITETALMQSTPHCISAINKFREQGLLLTLDDFGTGFSSLSNLKRLPFHKVKIDRAFVAGVADNVDDAAICKAIISMAHSLGIGVVAEGVESEAQCSFLSQNMCDEIQGFLFSDALDAVEVIDILQQDRCLPQNLLRVQKATRTLLLVDDEQNIISALRRLLRGSGFQILTANSGQAGLDILAQHQVDVIVSDQRMPGMTGVEFLRIAKDLYPETIRIVLSGYTELHSVTDAVNEGAIYKFLTKPWEDEQLRGHIEEAFRRKEMADENRRLTQEVLNANQELATANHQLEELLQQKQQQINRDEVSLDIVREALQQIPLPVIGIDDDDMVVFANDEAQALFEHTPSILGNDVNHLIPDLTHANPEASRKRRCTVELAGGFYEVLSRSMGSGSQSRGKLMTLSRLGDHV